MKLHYRSNLWAGILSLVTGGLLWVLIPSQIAKDIVQTSAVTSRTIPYMVAALFLLCGLGLVIQSLVFKNDEVKELDLGKEAIVVIYIAAILLYCVFCGKSFVVSTILLCIVTLALCRCKKVSYYLISVGVVSVLYYLFKMLLHVRLP